MYVCICLSYSSGQNSDFREEEKRAKVKEQRKLAFLSRRERMKSSLKGLKSSDAGLNA